MRKGWLSVLVCGLVTLLGGVVVGEEIRARWVPDAGEGLVLKDQSGNGCDVRLGGGNADNAPSRQAGFLDFDGLDDYGVVIASKALQDYGKGVTVTAWVYPLAQPFARSRAIVAQDMRIGLYLDKDNRPQAMVRPKGWKVASGDAPVPNDAWTYVALTYDGKAVRLYVNGDLVKTTDVDAPISLSGTRNLYVGRSCFSDDQYWCGLMGPIDIYGRALSGDEIKTRMSETKPAGPAPDDEPKATTVEQPLVANGGLEWLTGERRNIAGAWRPNAWGENTANFSKETEDVHGGASCQKIEVTAFTDGGVVLCQLGGPRLEANRRYRLEMWLKGNETVGEVTICLRKLEKWRPIPGFSKTVKPTTEWRKYRVIGKVAQDTIGNVAVSVRPERAGTLWIDDVTLTPMD